MVAWNREVAVVMKVNGPFQAIILKGESCGFSNWLYETWWCRMVRKQEVSEKGPTSRA